MAKVYAIATQEFICYGHGDYGKELKICQVDAYHKLGTFPPIFKDKSKAESYLDKLKWSSEKKVVELNLE